MIELIRSIVRPFIIIWGFVVYGICVMKGIEVPSPLSAIVAAIIIEYFGERVILRLREKK
ncbi:MAG: hypothetical protein FJ025_00090 [Chloroflexi bacterium]|nr:hypothetical protein [Chloroflexota bacterium]